MPAHESNARGRLLITERDKTVTPSIKMKRRRAWLSFGHGAAPIACRISMNGEKCVGRVCVLFELSPVASGCCGCRVARRVQSNDAGREQSRLEHRRARAINGRRSIRDAPTRRDQDNQAHALQAHRADADDVVWHCELLFRKPTDCEWRKFQPECADGGAPDTTVRHPGARNKRGDRPLCDGSHKRPWSVCRRTSRRHFVFGGGVLGNRK